MHRADQGDVIDTSRQMRKQATHFGSALSMRSKFPLGSLEVDAFIPRAILDLQVLGFDLLSVIAHQRRLGIKGVDV